MNSLVTCFGYDRAYKNDMYEFILDDNPVWRPINQKNTRPARTAAAYAYDSIFDRLYVYGGYSGNLNFPSIECFSFATNSWSLIDITPPLENRYSHFMVKSSSDTLITYGGSGGGNKSYYLVEINLKKKTSTKKELKFSSAIEFDYGMAYHQGICYLHQSKHLLAVTIHYEKDGPIQRKYKQWLDDFIMPLSDITLVINE